YYVIVPGAAVAAFLLKGPRALERASFTIALAFFVCYLSFSVFPVAGPRYDFPQIAGEASDGRLFWLVHTILESGSSKGTAFPSSHVAATISAWFATGRESKRVFWIMAPFAVSLALGTVYGRFHYGIDALVGLIAEQVSSLETATRENLNRSMNASARLRLERRVSKITRSLSGALSLAELLADVTHCTDNSFDLLELLQQSRVGDQPQAPGARAVEDYVSSQLEAAPVQCPPRVMLGLLGLSGALLPLLFHHLRGEVGELGSVAGRLYSWNTVGSLAGALIGGYVLLIWLDLDTVYAVALGALTIGAGILTTRVAGAGTTVAAGLTAVSLVAIALLPPWDPTHLAIGRFRTRAPTPVSYSGPTAFIEKHNQSTKLLFHDDDPVSTVVVLEAAEDEDVRSIMTNGKPDGSTGGDYPTMCLAGTIPALLTDDPSRSFVIGWGTGVTVGELAALPQTEEVVVAEISPGVLGAAPLFDPLNQGAITNPKVHPLRRDAYRALLRSEGRFGVIASEPSNPWVTGVEMLFSREFLEAARSRLTPGGVYAQWFHLYEVDAKTVDIVAATYASVFDRVAVWFARGPDVLLLGLNDPAGYPDLATIRARYEEPAMRAGMARCGAKNFHELLVHEMLPPGLVSAERVSGEIHSLRHPILSQHAARAFFSGRGVELPRLAGGPDARDGARPRALLARELGPGAVPEEIAADLARYVCEARRRPECAAWVGRWRADHPESVAARRYDPRSVKRMAESDKVSPVMLARAESLFRGVPPRDTARGNGLQRAAAVTNLFSILYNHAIPFDRGMLRRSWSACTQDGVPASTCQLARIRANNQLDRFELRRRPQGGS
ncbi:MAG: fused MFS/spermidine synthase, partial [Myxococcota bacterium]